MEIVLKNLNYISKIKTVRSKRKDIIFGVLFTFVLMCLLISPVAAAIEWTISPSDPIVGDTLKIQGTAFPEEKIKVEVSFEKEIPVSSEGRYEYLLEGVKVPKGDNTRFTVNASEVKNLHVGVKKVVWVNMRSTASEGFATISKANIPPWTYNKILIDGNALSNSPVYLEIKASQILKADSDGKFEYSYDTSSIPEGEFRIMIGDVEKIVELNSKEQEESVEDISTAPSTEKMPVKVVTGEKTESSSFTQLDLWIREIFNI